MARTFSYTFDLSPELKIARFKAESGEEYIIVHELTWSIYGNSLLSLNIECNVANSDLIVAEICSVSVDSIKRSSLLENKRAILNFQNINFMTHDPWRCIIHVIPHLRLQDLQDSMSISLSPLTPGKGNSIKMSKLEQLSADMEHILSTGDLSDVILTDGTMKIPAHKAILSARSQVFSRMFQHPMKENCENSVLISDVPEKVLKELVYFMYTGVITMEDMQMARNLYMAADKYAIQDLKMLCSDVLKNATFDDVLDTLALADLYEDTELKRSSLEFVNKNYSAVKSRKNWECFMKENQGLAIEILSFVIDNKV